MCINVTWRSAVSSGGAARIVPRASSRRRGRRQTGRCGPSTVRPTQRGRDLAVTRRRSRSFGDARGASSAFSTPTEWAAAHRPTSRKRCQSAPCAVRWIARTSPNPEAEGTPSEGEECVIEVDRAHPGKPEPETRTESQKPRKKRKKCEDRARRCEPSPPRWRARGV